MEVDNLAMRYLGDVHLRNVVVVVSLKDKNRDLAHSLSVFHEHALLILAVFLLPEHVSLSLLHLIVLILQECPDPSLLVMFRLLLGSNTLPRVS